VLRSKTAVWLSQRQEILSFCQARPTDGGAGAVLVLLKGRKG
jgi:DNA-nicking Smr family endonuclease